MSITIKKMAVVAKKLQSKYRGELESSKQNRSKLSSRNFLWHALLVCYSTWGSSRGFKGFIEDKRNYSQVTYDELKKLSPKARVQRLQNVMKQAKVLKYQEAPKLAACFQMIEEMGGLKDANKRFRTMTDTKEIIRFLKEFPGIGDKYSRNLPMDYYHPAFVNSIAVDARIKRVSKTLGLSFPNYASHEKFYLDVAQQAGIEGWELDRLIYSHQKEFLQELSI